MRLPVFFRPVRRRLPLLICLLLLAVVTVFSWAAHDRFERALLVAGTERVSSASQRLAVAVLESMRRGRGELRRFAADTALIRYLRSPNASAAGAARDALQRRLASTSPMMAVELRDKRGNQLLLAGVVPHGATLPAGADAVQSGDSGWRGVTVGPLAATGATAYYVAVTPVHGGGDALGYVAEYRRISSGSSMLLGQLIGSDAMVRMGNVGGGTWTDLAGVVPAPAHTVVPGRPLTVAGRSGEPSVAVGTRIDGTPWLVLVAIPRDEILRPAGDLLGAMLWLAAIVLAAGGFGAWFLSRQITRPLAEMTHAAEGMARGDYSLRVTADHQADELGRLAASFNTMAKQVETSTQTLEHHVSDRTRELENALRELRAAQSELVRRERAAGETRYKRLVETAHEGVWTTEAQGLTDYVNPRMAEMLGYAAEEMIGRPVLTFVHPDARAEAERSLARKRQGLHEVHEMRLCRRDGSEVWTLMSTAPLLTETGEFAGALAMVTDITDRRRLEAQVRQSQKMEAVGQLAGGVAHDFNNLLTVIKGFTTFLLEDLDEGDARRDDVREIDQAATRAAALTRQLLAFSRRQMLEPRLLDLNEVVAQFEKLLRRLIPSDIQLTLRLEPQLALVEADPGQLEQVLMNLAVNARDAMLDGGRLTIETSNAELANEHVGDHVPVVPGQYVALVVSDTGCGIDKAIQARIFEPFFTTKEKGKGTGLGLSTVYGIVKQSGGYVWVDSEPGKGTTFRLYLPRAAESAAGNGVAAEDTRNAPASAPTILLVEDDAAVRGMARRVLDRHGYRVLEATTGADALRVCEEANWTTIDLIVSDLVMPEMGGRELAEQVRARQPTVRLLFISGYTEDAVMRRSFLDPREAFLQKPFTPDALAKKVRDVLDRPAAAVAPPDAYKQVGPERVQQS